MVGTFSTLTRHTIAQLKEQCCKRGLCIGGTKAELVGRLSGSDTGPPHDRYHGTIESRTAAPSPPSTTPPTHTRTISQGLGDLMAEEDLTSALQDMASVEASYQNAINGELDSSGGNKDGEMGEEEGEGDRGAQQDDNNMGGMGCHAAAANDNKNNNNMAWVDLFILKTQCSGGQQTKTLVWKTYKAWLPGALHEGIMPDTIIDANHMIHYLKYATTHCLFMKQGKEKKSDECFSAVCCFPFLCMLV
ncbi:hypothetical protein V8E53_013101 [Lactarius tabidus]